VEWLKVKALILSPSNAKKKKKVDEVTNTMLSKTKLNKKFR
jgi:hypothetical protein